VARKVTVSERIGELGVTRRKPCVISRQAEA
jgi:hypothetical protein